MTLLSPYLLDAAVRSASPESLFLDFVIPRIPQRERPGVLLIDVGASSGTFVISAARAGLRVKAFEPSPRCSKVLMPRVAAFLAERGRGGGAAGTSASVSVHCAAVGHRSGAASFTDRGLGSTARYLSPSSSSAASANDSSSGASGTSVPVLRLEEALRANESGFVLKTDTQGFERNVLLGADAHLRRKAPRLLLVELSDGLLRAQGTSALELMRTIASYDYDCTFLQLYGGYHKGGSRGRGSRARPCYPCSRRKPLSGWMRVDAPAAIANRSTISFEEMTLLLGQLRGWTDLLCWW